MASKNYQTAKEVKLDNLYWPFEVGNYDMLKIEAYQFVPISSLPSNETSNSLSNIQSKGPKTSLATILLPVPESINYTDALSWGETNVGAISKVLGKAASAAAGGDTEKLTASLQTAAAAGMGPLVLKKLSEVTGANAESITAGAGGVVLNPYKEQVFSGIGMRNFNFTWKLVPRNSAEQVRIHNIIKALRYYSLPKYSGNSGLVDSDDPLGAGLEDRWLTVPNTFSLKWQYASGVPIQSLPNIKPCVLKNVTVNYTPDGVWATHMTNSQSGLSGPAPVAYNLTLDFSETEIITADDVLTNKSEGGY